MKNIIKKIKTAGELTLAKKVFNVVFSKKQWHKPDTGKGYYGEFYVKLGSSSLSKNLSKFFHEFVTPYINTDHNQTFKVSFKQFKTLMGFNDDNKKHKNIHVPTAIKKFNGNDLIKLDKRVTVLMPMAEKEIPVKHKKGENKFYTRKNFQDRVRFVIHSKKLTVFKVKGEKGYYVDFDKLKNLKLG